MMRMNRSRYTTMDVALVLALCVAVGFTLTNGFLDAATAIATLVATRIARPGRAIILASFFNLIGPFIIGSAVANTIGKIVSVPSTEAIAVIGAGLTGAVTWNLISWSRGIPSSSSHALVGGLTGAAIADAGLAAVNWGPFSGGHITGVLGVLIILAVAPIIGVTVAYLFERVALRMTRRLRSDPGNRLSSLQWVTSGWLAFSHGSNDAQKTIGVMAALLVAGGVIPTISDVPVWVILLSSSALTFGTAFGGWGIVKTIGKRIYPIRPIDGLVSQSTSASAILVASLIGAPVSTTQVVSSSVVGAGLGRGRMRHVRWHVVRDILFTWLTTLPASAIIAVIVLPAWKALGH